MRLPIRSIPALLAMALALAAGVAHAQSVYWIETNYGAPTLNQTNLDGVGITSMPLGAGTLPEGLAAGAGTGLYFTEAGWANARVNHAAYDLSGVAPVVAGGSTLRGIAIHEPAQLLYWTASNLIAGAAIYRASLTGAGATPLIALPPGANPRGIAVDDATGRIYWADFDLHAIYTANGDGTGVGVLIPVPGAPYGVAVDPAHGFVFWTDYTSGTLNRALLTGGGATNLVSNMINPTYLTVDPGLQRVYWIEAALGGGHMGRVGYTGAGYTILPQTISSYGGLAFAPPPLAATRGDPPPIEYALSLRPSPARGPVRVSFVLPTAGRVRLGVLDLQGREVARILDEPLPAGRYERIWSAQARAAGVYFVRMSAGGRTWTRRAVVTGD